MTTPPPAQLLIGSDPKRCHLVARRRTVSSVHAAIRRDAEGGFLLIDLGSTNGTVLRGKRLEPDEPVPISPGDVITLGRRTSFTLTEEHVEPLMSADDDEPIPVGDPIIVVDAADPGPAPGQPPGAPATGPAADPAIAVRVPRKTSAKSLPEEPAAPTDPAPTDPAAPSLSIGYAPTNDIVVTHPSVAERHARIVRSGEGRFILEDLGSLAGTFVAGTRVERAELSPGQRFSVGSHVLALDQELVERLDPAVPGAPVSLPSDLEPGRVLVIGRRSSCDVPIPAPSVSGKHAQLTVLPDRSGFLVEDLGSTNGTYIGARTNRVEAPTRVAPDDILFLGSYRLPLARLPALLVDARAPAEPERNVVIVGRDATSVDVHIDAPVVSARHASVEIRPDGTFRVRDLGSSNGTFLNGVPVRGETVATASDRLSLGSYEVRLDPERGVVRREYHGDIMLQAERISVDVPDPRAPGRTRRVLNDVSFTAYPTEIVGLMGPSGAGKTTLMMALGGLLPPTHGRSLLNGLDVYERYNAFRGNIGYVPQDDIVYPQLTVYQSLYYTARLRLPADTTREEIDAKIDAILADLEILHTRDTLIGDALDKGISGGERKRVNVAQELITGPALLFLDEPTSGLASEDALNVMRLLRTLADAGKTILLTIHQPSLDAYRLMDTVLYLSRGTAVFYGPAFPDSILHFNRDVPAGPERERLLADPANAMKPLVAAQRSALAVGGEASLKHCIEEQRQTYERSGYHREFVQERARGADDVDLTPAGVQKARRRGMVRQLRWLAERTARIKLRDRVNTTILVAQAPIIAAILWLVFARADADPFEALRRGPAALFLLVASAVWFGCSNAAREIVGELPIFRRERMVNLVLPAYALSKVAVLGLVCAVQCLVLLGIVYLPLGLEGSFGALYLILLLTSLVGLGMGLTLSALVRSQQAAVALVPLMLIPQIILGGVIMPVHDMGPATRLLASLTATRWGFEGALHAEFADDDLAAIRRDCEIPTCVWGTGATGFAYTYYPGDPAAAADVRHSAGVEALQAQGAPFVRPNDDPICQAFCASVQEGAEISPLDRAFGPDPSDPERVRAVSDIATDGHAPDLLGPSPTTTRTSFAAASGVLGFYFAFFVALVVALLRLRDVEVE